MKRLLAAASLAVAVAVFGLSTRGPEATGLLVGALLTAICFAGRWQASKAVQRLTSGTAVVMGIAAAQLLLDEAPGVVGRGGIGLFFGTTALSSLLSAGVRRLFSIPEGGRRAEVALEAVALVACGMTRLGPAYAMLATAWVLLVLASLRWQSTGPRPALETRRPLATLAVLGLAAALASGFAYSLPRLEELAERRILQWIAGRRAGSGFSDTIRLGSLEKLFRSDTVVLRLWGPASDYLRGNAYSRYRAGYWSSRGGLEQVTTSSGRPPGARVEARFAGEARRYFLPLGARDVATERGLALRDIAGSLRPPRGDVVSAYWFTTGPEADAHLAPPSSEELDVPEPLMSQLAPLAAEWTAGRESARAKTEALTERLQHGYAYSLEVRSTPGVDPIVDFLFRGKRGHCEYFASALTLLVRSAGVPARVVGGYRSLEVNAMGGYGVVRERDAHTWVEAWLPGEGWRTFDATPAGEGPRRSPLLFVLGDAVSTGFTRGLTALRNLTPAQTAALLASAIALFAVVRAWNARQARKNARANRSSAPLPSWYERFAKALARAGYLRHPSETLERFARRLASANQLEAAALLERYAALRYGGVGEPSLLAREMEGCAERLGAKSPAP